MNWDRIEGNWKQFKGQIKEKWGKLTDDELDVVAGRRDQFLGKLQEKYGLTKDEAQRQIQEFERSCKEVPERAVR
ncbi:MAG: CsbD family protein [Acidobacteria bacterium]|nr:CsbD family protein [Acidobacteriota bacterium]MCI0719724.1 CsbD family protein [Acidobacteriota bacterium]